ncbi:hypothetical protein HMPREF0290_1112, partial [Corynebacterium efficiens YS-314]
ANGHYSIQDPTMTTPNTNFDPNLYPQPQPDLSEMQPVQGYSAPFAQEYRTTTPAWDPLAPNPNTWDIQHVPAHRPEKKKKRVWPWVLGILVIGGVVSTVALGTIVDETYSGLEDTTAIGDMMLAPTDGNLQDSYTSGVGEMELDLTGLTAVDEDRSVQISSGVGEVTVILPEEIPVNLTCMAGIGTTRCDVPNLNANADQDAGALNIHVNSGIGEVRVQYAE